MREERHARPASTVGHNRIGPLVVHPANPRYLADPTGRPVYLSGSHTWAVVQDGGPESPPEPLDWASFLAQIVDYGHTFTRLWTWEHPRWASWWKGDYYFTPTPWERVGEQTARDGGPKFDLSRVNERWIERLRDRVSSALDAGIYVSVMLFQGWSAGPKPDPWTDCENPWMSHPFHRDNNVNGIDGSPDDEQGHDRVHTLADANVVEFQERYVRAVVDAVNEFPNVLYEIGNEHDGSPENSLLAVPHDRCRARVRARGEAIPTPAVYMSAQWPDPRNGDLLESPAEAVVPFAWREPGDERWEYEPPAEHVGKVVFLDTDHLWGVGGNVDWVWRSFMRGYQPLYMDPWGYGHMDPLAPAGREDVRRALGATCRLAAELDLSAMRPRPDVVNTGFALYDGSAMAVVYQPYEDRLRLNVGRDLRGAIVEWRDLVDDAKRAPGSIRPAGGGGCSTRPGQVRRWRPSTSANRRSRGTDSSPMGAAPQTKAPPVCPRHRRCGRNRPGRGASPGAGADRGRAARRARARARGGG